MADPKWITCNRQWLPLTTAACIVWNQPDIATDNVHWHNEADDSELRAILHAGYELMSDELQNLNQSQ